MTSKEKEERRSTTATTTKASGDPQLRALMLRGGPQAVTAVLVLAAHGWFMWHMQSAYDAMPDKSHVGGVIKYVDLWVPVFILSMLAEAGALPAALPPSLFPQFSSLGHKRRLRRRAQRGPGTGR
jgi:hypothetical protein